jgi:hypothetical protein
VTDLRTFHFVVGQGGSFGASSLQVEAGLGASTRIERVEVDWPGGMSEVISGVQLGQVVVIREGDGVVDSHAFAGLPLPTHAEQH